MCSKHRRIVAMTSKICYPSILQTKYVLNCKQILRSNLPWLTVTILVLFPPIHASLCAAAAVLWFETRWTILLSVCLNPMQVWACPQSSKMPANCLSDPEKCPFEEYGFQAAGLKYCDFELPGRCAHELLNSNLAFGTRIFNGTSSQ